MNRSLGYVASLCDWSVEVPIFRLGIVVEVVHAAKDPDNLLMKKNQNMVEQQKTVTIGDKPIYNETGWNRTVLWCLREQVEEHFVPYKCVSMKKVMKHVENFSLPTFSTSRIHAKSRLTQRKPKNSGVNWNQFAWLSSYLATFSGQFVAFPRFSSVCLCVCHHLFPRFLILRSC